MGSSSSSKTSAADSAEANGTNQKHICVIGAGPVGLGAIKIITDSPEFKAGQWTVTAFEARDGIGGIWYPAPPDADPPLTALYDSLTTNTPHPLMSYTSFPFRPETPLYPPASTVLAYLQDYAKTFELYPHIRFNTPVLSVRWNAQAQKWDVTVAGEEHLKFDLVLVANGHYRVPRFPATKGLDAWHARGKVTHSAWYRRPEDYTGKIIVVGGGYSGMDVASETRPFAKEVVWSITGVTPEDEDGGKFKKRGRVAEYLDADEGTVVFEDGTSESGIDHVILATGYQFNFPFLSEPDVAPTLPPQPSPPIAPLLYNSTYHIFPLAKHLFPLVSSYPPSSLAFLGLPLRVAPLPLAEIQTQTALKVFSDPTSLDLEREAEALKSRYEHFRALKGDDEVAIADAWFRFGIKEQFDYRDELYEFVGTDYRIPRWERELFEQKDLLRERCRELERDGEAEAWLRGVGTGPNPVEEWADFMWKVLEGADVKSIVHEQQ
ncbi:FAD/NAD(P)-binding domain-containing protein [Trametes coccinea BRFM310]|uniref:FAD/NAD(P)-binding domain-containing protein n=1 Tax=Trametes coccinea (strain BRFM310) TaxID=1353009 RepID=A0A1Y2IJY6_TRAC3|nr:FAD/NAD(P)-binding domain-containing protein [Trametes coccinea BRFM310]